MKARSSISLQRCPHPGLAEGKQRQYSVYIDTHRIRPGTQFLRALKPNVPMEPDCVLPLFTCYAPSPALLLGMLCLWRRT